MPTPKRVPLDEAHTVALLQRAASDLQQRLQAIITTPHASRRTETTLLWTLAREVLGDERVGGLSYRRAFWAGYQAWMRQGTDEGQEAHDKEGNPCP